MSKSDVLRKTILNNVSEFYESEFCRRGFVPGETSIPVSGKVFDEDELVHLVDSSLDFWLTTGRFAKEFEREFSKFLKIGEACLCNSGSSANLLAISTLTSKELGKRCLIPGDEIITVAAGFPTTVNPIIQNRFKPVFVDIELETCNVDINRLAEAVTPKTKAVICAHTLGNPFEINKVRQITQKHNLWLIEDNCDALGSKYKEQLTGTFGDMATSSFYPAHQITMGEGGCVTTNDVTLKKVITSFRDWGRDCWCDPGKDNTCGKRFGHQKGNLPEGYDHKYIYSHIGYNLKLTDMQAAVGLAQIKKINHFIQKRKHNWNLLYNGLKSLEEFFILPQPTPESDPSWFGFLLTIRPDAPFLRVELLKYLDKHKIGTRLLFGGNITKHPAYENVDYKISNDLKNTDIAMNQSFWLGVYPGITDPMIEYMIESIQTFINSTSKIEC